mgnify:FL=1
MRGFRKVMDTDIFVWKEEAGSPFSTGTIEAGLNIIIIIEFTHTPGIIAMPVYL